MHGNRFGRVFPGDAKPIIAMAHLGPLPGTPLYDEARGVRGIVDDVARDLDVLLRHPFDAVMFCNERDRPYSLRAGFEGVAVMSRVVTQLAPTDRPFGVDFLWDGRAALSVAQATGAGIWAEDICRACGVEPGWLAAVTPADRVVGAVSGLRIPVTRRDQRPGAALGAAFAAGMAVGAFDSWAAIAGLTVAGESTEPDPRTARRYEDLYGILPVALPRIAEPAARAGPLRVGLVVAPVSSSGVRSRRWGR